MDHQFENLTPERFQQLCQSLIVKEFPQTTCFPIGQPDGGRDAIKHGSSPRNVELPSVFQIKFSRNTLDGDTARKWLFETIGKEKAKIQELKERGLKEYVIITNVAGTAHQDVGSIDKLVQEFSNAFEIPVLCWWRDDLNRRLDGNWDIKLRYPEILSGPDFLRLLIQTEAGQHRERRRNALRAFLADQYLEDVEVKCEK
jgi:hypothetical protein